MSATAIYKKNRRKRVTFATTGAEDANRTRDIVVVCCARCKGSVLCLLASQLLLSPKRLCLLGVPICRSLFKQKKTRTLLRILAFWS